MISRMRFLTQLRQKQKSFRRPIKFPLRHQHQLAEEKFTRNLTLKSHAATYGRVPAVAPTSSGLPAFWDRSARAASYNRHGSLRTTERARPAIARGSCVVRTGDDGQLYGTDLVASWRMWCSGAHAVVHRHEQGARLRASRPQQRRGRVCDLPPHSAFRRASRVTTWRDRRSGKLTRRLRVVGHEVPVREHRRHVRRLHDFVFAAALLRSAAVSSRKHQHYPGQPNWIGKLDTIVHELYHIDPANPGIRRMERADGTYSANCHGTASSRTSSGW